MTDHEIFTIGHSNHSIEKFVELLRLHGVTAVADVRSAPYSRFNPQYNRDALDAALKRQGIAYVFLGRELGARSTDPSCYENGRVQYRRLAETDAFHAGIERVQGGAQTHKIALMCAEREPLECHRTLLVSRALDAAGFAVKHILADGLAELHKDSMKRLLKLVRLPEEDMFKSQEELIAEACVMQEQRIAYVDEQLVDDGGKVAR
jgi:uncharacterized protein (DUF488 family)